jgi:hypothetical protein
MDATLCKDSQSDIIQYRSFVAEKKKEKNDDDVYDEHSMHDSRML